MVNVLFVVALNVVKYGAGMHLDEEGELVSVTELTCDG